MSTNTNLMGAVLIVSLTGCVATSPNWDARFGEAARMTTAQQVIDPDASMNTDAVMGIDGKAAGSAMTQYHKSFTNPETPTGLFSINVGSDR